MDDPHSRQARIGPNSIIRVIEAMSTAPGPNAALEVFTRAGIAQYLDAPPSEMVDEVEVKALHRALRDILGVERARKIGRDAGRRTGDYLLANRIPPLAQTLLKHLPAALAGRLLLKAISRNAWTFVGGGEFSVSPGTPHRLQIAGCGLCDGARSSVPLCDYYGASFERLFQSLVSPSARVIESECQAQGYSACIFEVDARPMGKRLRRSPA